VGTRIDWLRLSEGFFGSMVPVRLERSLFRGSGLSSSVCKLCIDAFSMSFPSEFFLKRFRFSCNLSWAELGLTFGAIGCGTLTSLSVDVTEESLFS
jgi:hypothetical protein